MSANNTMTVHYDNGEKRKYKVDFEAHDLEALCMPMLAGLVVEVDDNKQVMINMDKVIEIEIIVDEG